MMEIVPKSSYLDTRIYLYGALACLDSALEGCLSSEHSSRILSCLK